MSNVNGWGEVWKGMRGIEFGREPYMWRFYEKLLGDYDFSGKRVLELGCGTGINTILMAKRGARVTFLDYSKGALDIVRRNMEQEGVDGEFILGNMFDVDIEDQFDIVHSEGVVEHFLGKQRQGVVDRHAAATRRGGRVVIIVPQVGSFFYRTGKFMAELTGSWIHGKEYPYGRRELVRRLSRAGLEVERTSGGELFMAFGWLFSPLWLRDGSVLERSIRRPANKTFFRLNYDNWAANRWGRVIAGVGIKR